MTQERTVSLKQLATPAKQRPSFYTKPNTATPKARVQGMPEGWDWGLEHYVYVTYTGKAYEALQYTTIEQKALRDFVVMQDKKHAKKRLKNGSFPRVGARVCKVHPSTPEYADGKRWQFSYGRGVLNFKQEFFADLDKMLVALDNALA